LKCLNAGGQDLKG